MKNILKLLKCEVTDGDVTSERRAPLEERVCGSQHAVDDVEVSAPEARHHLRQQVGPLLREVLSADDADGVAQLQETGSRNTVRRRHLTPSRAPARLPPHLLLDLLRAAQHQVHDVRFDRRPVCVGDFVWFIFNL